MTAQALELYLNVDRPCLEKVSLGPAHPLQRSYILAHYNIVVGVYQATTVENWHGFF